MEEAAARIAQDNCELACCFIQKTAVEKAGPEMDKRLATVRPQNGTISTALSLYVVQFHELWPASLIL